MNEVKIEDLKQLAQEHDQQGIIAFCIERDGTIRCVTYGEDKLKCDAAGWWGQGTAKNLSVVPFQTVFGWGNEGEPLHLTEEQIFDEISNAIPREFL